jgi:serine/threonine-protein kinase
MTIAASEARTSSGLSNPHRPTSSPSDGVVDEGSFLPGTILLERYRVTGLLGRGGMGEVYRATDLKLGQQVALKFLPPAASAQALTRFTAEVRMARQVSHPNVCRVYDIGEVDGAHFLSMEYVPGEDLASLLRRIGRVPGDKAVEIARQLCSGLAAAHEKGVLHRDLKPSNILINGEGSVVIADFGLAAAEETRAGTPAYMAPEQLEGREVTTRSDIYALGLVLYELFSGRRAMQANSLAELQTLHGSTPRGPSEFVKDIDPAVEQVVLRCLAPDPELRPASARAVAAALPGGDPLAAALAAGETPSPALVAAAGEATGISPRNAAIALALVLGGLIAIWFAMARMNDLATVTVVLPPEVMADRAKTMIRNLGYSGKPVDEVWAYRNSEAFFQYRKQTEHRNAQFSPVHFWYRSANEQLTNLDASDAGVVIGSITPGAPPPTKSGTMQMNLDPDGHLLRFRFVTPEREPAEPATPAKIDWPATMRTAGYDPAHFRSVDPAWLSDGFSDQRAAWIGREPSVTSEEIRIEAAAWRGRLVSFQAIFPWTEPSRSPRPERPGRRWSQVFFLTTTVILLTAALYMARRNLRAGRGDRRGATRLAGFVLSLHMVAFFLGAHHPADESEMPLIVVAFAFGLVKAALLWVAYIAVEPSARRRWPHSLISWTRLLDGRWRDPLAGRDILVGCLAAVGAATAILLMVALERSTGDIRSSSPSPNALGDIRTLVAWLTNSVGIATMSTLGTFLILFLLRTVLRKDWIAVLACGLLFSIPSGLGNQSFLAGYVAGVLVNTLIFAVAARVGLTSMFVVLALLNLLLNVPATTDFGVWYSTGALIVFIATALLALWAFRTATAGRQVFRHAD